MREGYVDPVLRTRESCAFLQLYARVLTNYGAFCLINFASQRSVYLLQEALRVLQECDALMQHTQQMKRNRIH